MQKMKGAINMDQETKNAFLKMVEMMEAIERKIDKVGEDLGNRIGGLEERMDRLEERMDRLEERMDRLEERMDRLEQEVSEIKEGQKTMNDRLDTLASMYGPHEEAIRRLKAMKIL
jgi:chromosome segregation ATPase